MKIFGFHMLGSRKKSNQSKRCHHYSIFLLFTGSFMVLSTVALHCTSFVYGVLRLKVNGLGPNGTNLTTANLLNIGIEHLNNTWFNIGVHCTFFFVSLTSNWTHLWDSLLLIEKNMKFKSSFYRKSRKSISIGFGFLLLVIIFTSSYCYYVTLTSLIVIYCNRIA